MFLPITKKELNERGVERPDFVYISGDAYVDHPSFGTAIISRVLEKEGFSVAIIAQPDVNDVKSIDVFGEPKLGFLVSSGNMDSMVNHYYVSKKRRKKDMYSPGGQMGKRPDYAVSVYGKLIRKTYKDTPIIIGGIEASLRRLAHYDYWSEEVKKSVLLESQADLLIYGMGEKAVTEIAYLLKNGTAVKDITYVKGTVFKTDIPEFIPDATKLPSYNEIVKSKESYAKSFYKQYKNTDAFTAKVLVESYSKTCFVVQNPPQPPLTTAEMDEVYALPYMRDFHPSYIEKGGIPAIEEVKFSLISCRGCFGACNFCALTFHQGRIIQVRSHESLIEEAKKITEMEDFKGYIHDVGGPTANFRIPSCQKQLKKGTCGDKQCLFPKPCKNLDADHSDFLELLRKLRTLPKVKKVFVRSGIRFDYLLHDENDEFFYELVKHHVSGQLKVAPEHVSDNVLSKMGKPSNSVYNAFCEKYKMINKKLSKEQYVVPYLMSSHPGSNLKEAIELALYIKDLGYMPEQVQDFYPTPSTLATCMYYTGIDPRDMKEVFVAKSSKDKSLQRALIQYKDPKNYDLVVEALLRARRKDLIGTDKKCLVKPKAGDKRFTEKKENKKNFKGKGKKGNRNSYR